MKKLAYLMLALPLALLNSCDKDEITPFDMTLTLSGVSQVDNSFVAVAGDDVTIDALEVESLGNKTAVANVLFYVDGVPLLGAPWDITQPSTFSTANLAPGNHTLNVTGTLLQVDQSLKSFAVNYPLQIVETQDDLPSGAPAIGTYSITLNFTDDK